MTGVAVAVSTGLLLSGCTGDDTVNGAGGKDTSAESKPQQDSGASQGGGEDGGETGGEAVAGPVDAAGLKGQWETGSVADGDYVVLGFTEGGTSVLTMEASCHGTYTQAGDEVGLEMKCSKGSGFEKGTVTGMGEDELTVEWAASGETDVFTRTTD